MPSMMSYFKFENVEMIMPTHMEKFISIWRGMRAIYVIVHKYTCSHENAGYNSCCGKINRCRRKCTKFVHLPLHLKIFITTDIHRLSGRKK